MNSNIRQDEKMSTEFLGTYLHVEDERNGVEAGKTEEEAAASNKMVVALQASMGVLERSGTLTLIRAAGVVYDSRYFEEV
jgi:hypothetical protein